MAKKELKAFLKDNKFDVTKETVDEYAISLKNYLANINDAIQNKESEEHLKGIFNKFLKDTLYSDDKYTINTKGAIDAAISKDNNLQVIMEVKRPANVDEMITETNLNKKALWEIILYYIENTRKIKEGKAKRNPDSEIKNIVITDCKKFFVFDSQKIEAVVQGELVKFWEQKENGQLISKNNDIFYDKEKEFFAIEENLSKLDFVYFDIEELSKNQTGLTSTYKMLSRQILLKDKAKRMVASPLNSAFYQELLYILGLNEEIENGKPVIKINFNVENTFAVQVYKYLKDDKGILDENEVIDKTFSAIIVWTNRLLFIKLFEGQLFAINGEKQEYRILDNDKIQNENDLQKLFFQVLGTKNRESEEFFDQFKNIPYLNSSLFEQYDVEKSIVIKDIDNIEIEIKQHSKTGRKGKVKLIEYVIDFLNSYSFSSVSVGDGEVSGGKDIIDAATLGLIFEKINGYKDGSFYTPSSITEYICKEAIELSVIQKINEAYKQNIETFDDLKFFVSEISKGNLQEKKKINEIINSLKICDPAVGSGHFLVSALNRIIAIKSELGVLFYYNENRLLSEYEVKVVDDILTITDGNGESFVYNRGDVGSLKVQKTIFCEKRQIIENCLFGVDINDKAVAICQLRLWIELLKNAYYENNVMETLPNIDINIKCGNSLVHKLPVEVGKKLSDKIDKDLKKEISEYRQWVNKYKKENDKIIKQKIKNVISELKRILHQSAVQTSMDFMNDATNYSELELMKNAFEWAIEFPEVLSDDGIFLGFDCVIGNPPYIQLQKSISETNKTKLGDIYANFDYVTFAKTGDIYCLFYEKGYKLLKANGILTYITSNKWMRAAYGERLRGFLGKYTNPLILLDLGSGVFESATVDTNILVFQKADNMGHTLSCTLKVNNQHDYPINLIEYVRQNGVISNFGSSDSWVILSSIEKRIKDKIDKYGTPLREWELSIYRGVLTGFNDAFIITQEKRDELIKEDPKSAEIIRPILRGRDIKRYEYTFADLWMICTFPSRHYNIDNFPAIKKHLLSFGIEHLEQTGKTYIVNNKKITARKKTTNKWFETQDTISYWDDFSKQKIIYPETTQGAYFIVDDGNFFADKTCFIMLSKCPYYLLATLSSSLFEFAYKHIYSSIALGDNGYQYNKHALLLLPIISTSDLDNAISDELSVLALAALSSNSTNSKTEIINSIDKLIYDIYHITAEEIEYINNHRFLP